MTTGEIPRQKGSEEEIPRQEHSGGFEDAYREEWNKWKGSLLSYFGKEEFPSEYVERLLFEWWRLRE